MVRIWRYLRKIWLPFQQCAAPQRSAAVCYYLFLSIPSFLSLFFRLYTQFPVLSQSLQQSLQGIIPNIFWEISSTYFQTLWSPETVSLSLAAILWSVSRAVTALTEGLNAAIGIPSQEPFFQKRLRASFQFLLLAIGVLGSLSFVVYGRQFLSLLQFSTNRISSAHFFAIMYLTISFTVIYRILPEKKQPVPCCILGAFAAAIGWYGFSCLYSTYVSIMDNPADPFGTILMFMIWLQICFTVLFYGCVLTKLSAEKKFDLRSMVYRIFQARKPKQ